MLVLTALLGEWALVRTDGVGGGGGAPVRPLGEPASRDINDSQARNDLVLYASRRMGPGGASLPSALGGVFSVPKFRAAVERGFHM